MIKIDADFVSKIVEKARKSERKRMNYNFHKFPEDPINRMVHGMEPDTYVQPHKHENPDKREAFIILKGRVAVVEYSDEGKISEIFILDSHTGNFGVEIPSRTWHSLVCLETGSVIYEIKDGPYNPEDDKCFAPWAPKEGDTDAFKFNEKILGTMNQKS